MIQKSIDCITGFDRQVTWNSKYFVRKRKRKNERNEKYSDRHGGSQGSL